MKKFFASDLFLFIGLALGAACVPVGFIVGGLGGFVYSLVVFFVVSFATMLINNIFNDL
jgi:hypothetical protein